MATRRKAAGGGTGVNPVFVPEYLIAAKGHELVKRLQHAFDTVRGIAQADHSELPPGLDNVASQVVHDNLLKSKNKEIALLSTCVAVEILRIYAPEAPYNELQLLGIFDSILEQLEHLRRTGADMDDELSSSLFDRANQILTSLHDFRSCCILSSELAVSERYKDKAEELIVALFRQLLNCVSAHSPQQVLEYSADIIAFVIDDLDALTPAMFLPLFQSIVEKASNETACQVATAVLVKLESKLSIPIATTVNALLASLPTAAKLAAKQERRAARRAKSRGKRDDEVESLPDEEDLDEEDEEMLARANAPFHKRDVLHNLIVALASIVPSAMLLVLPPLAQDLDSDNIELRTSAISVCGRVFASSATTSSADGAGGRLPFGKAYAVQFDAWLRRFRDKEPAIRAEMCKLGGEVLREHGILADLIVPQIIDRTRDADDEVRKSAVIVACDCACERLDHVPRTLLEATAERLQDRSFDVRREAATGLAQAYASHMPAIWQKVSAFAATQPTAERATADIATTGEAPRAAGKRGRGAAGAATVPASERIRVAAVFKPVPADAEIISKLAWIPDRVLLCFEHPEMEMKVRVIQLLDCIFLPESLEEEARGVGLLRLYGNLSMAARASFWRIQTERARMQQLVSTLLTARSDVRSAQLSDSADGRAHGLADLQARLLRAGLAVAELAGGGARTAGCIAVLMACVPDNRVFRLLSQLTEPCAPMDTLKAARDDLLGRVKAMAANSTQTAADRASKVTALMGASAAPAAGAVDMKAVAEVVRGICRRMVMSTLTSGMFAQIIAYVQYLLAANDDEALDTALHFLQHISSIWPRLFIHGPDEGSSKTAVPASLDILVTLCGMPDSPLVRPALQALGHVGPLVVDALPSRRLESLRALLLRLCTTATDHKVAKAACTAGCLVFVDASLTTSASARSSPPFMEPSSLSACDAFFLRLSRTITSSIDAEHEHALAVLAACGALARQQPAVFATLDDVDEADMDDDGAAARVPRGILPSSDPDGSTRVMLGRITRAVIGIARHALQGEEEVVVDAAAEPPRRARPRKAAAPALSDSDSDDAAALSDSDSDAGFRKRKPGSRRRAAAARPAKERVPTHGEQGDGAEPQQDQECLYNAKTALHTAASVSTRLRLAALKSLLDIARGAMRRYVISSTAPPGHDGAEHLHRAAGVAAALVRLASDVLECGGDLHAPKSRIDTVLRPRHAGDTPAHGTELAAASPARSVASMADSRPPVHADSSSACMRFAAAHAILNLVSALPAGMETRMVPIDAWLHCARAVIDVHPDARRAVLHTMSKLHARQPLSLRWMALFPLGACDTSASVRKANKDSTLKSFLAFRRFARALPAEARGSPANTLEYALPLGIFLLAHDVTRFPSHVVAKAFLAARGKSKTDAHASADSTTAGAAGSVHEWGPFQDSVPYVSALLDGILSSLSLEASGNDAGAPAFASGSMSLMFTILSKLQSCEDAVEPSNRGIHDAASVAFLLLKTRAKDQRAYATYPGEIRLPNTMFRPLAPQSQPARTPAAGVVPGRSAARVPTSAGLLARSSAEAASTSRAPRETGPSSRGAASTATSTPASTGSDSALSISSLATSDRAAGAATGRGGTKRAAGVKRGTSAPRSASGI